MHLKKLILPVSTALLSMVLTNPLPDLFTPAILDQMILYSQYSSAVYCNNTEEDLPGALVTCTFGTCPLVEAAKATIYGNFFNIGEYNTTGMVAIDYENSNIVLAFRGAEFHGIYSQLVHQLIPCPAVCAECNCHTGYYQTWTDVRDIVIKLVKGAKKQYPNYEIVVTGHSLGGAGAIYAAAELRTNGTQATLFTFGQPHTGDEAFAEYVSAQGSNYRVTHTDDPAPKGNTSDPSMGYRHIQPEYWIYEDRNENFTVAMDQIDIIFGYNSQVGNQGTDPTFLIFDEAAHVQYFQPQIAACYQNITNNDTL